MVSKWFRLRNDLYCVEWGVQLYSLTRIKVVIWYISYNLKLFRIIVMWSTGRTTSSNPVLECCVCVVLK